MNVERNSEIRLANSRAEPQDATPNPTSMSTTPPLPPEKKGMSCLAMSGIGCLVIIVALFLGGGAVIAKFWPQIQEWVAEAESNPEKAAAKLGIKVVPGAVIIREDDAKSEFTFKIGADGEEMTLNYKDIQSGRQPVITNSKGEVIQLPKKGEAAPAPAVPAPAASAPAEAAPAPASPAPSN